MLELRLGGDDVFLPAVGVADVLAEGGIEALGILLLHHTLAVGRVADDDTLGSGQIHLGGIPVPEGNAVGHTGLAGVGNGQGNALGVIVRAKNLVLAVEFPVLGLCPDIPPDLGVAPGEGFSGKPAVHTGGLVSGDEGSFNSNGSGAAEGVPDEVPAPVLGQHDHSGSQGLPEGCFVGVGPVAPLVEAGAGGVQIQLDTVIHNGKLQLILGAGFGQPGDAVLLAQALGGRLLDDGLAVGDAHQLGAEAVALHRELAVPGKEPLQRGIVDTLEQLLKGGGLEVGNGDQHTFTGAQADIGLGHGGFVAGEEDPAVLHPDVFQVQPTQLVTGNALQTKQAGHGKFKLIHITSVSRTFPLGEGAPEGGRMRGFPAPIL